MSPPHPLIPSLSPDARAQREGLLLLLLSAAGYACLPTLAKWAYAAGLEPLDLVTWRFLLATPLVWLVVRLRGSAARAQPRAALLGTGLLFGILAWTAFLALDRLPASTYVVLLYTYPATVALLSRLLGERLSPRGWGALVLTLVGVALVVPDAASGLAQSDRVGIILVLLNATLYAVYIVVSGRLLAGRSGLMGASAWSITGSLLLLGGLALLRGLAWPGNPAAWASVAALAVVSTVLPIAAFYAGLQRVGAARAAILSTVEPLLTLALAVLLLHERLSAQQWLGGSLILASVLLIQLPLKRRRGRAA